MKSNHLHTVHIQPIPANKQTHFPFNIPAIQGNTEIECTTPVTFLVAYEELEHVTVMRSFLHDPEQYLRHL